MSFLPSQQRRIVPITVPIIARYVACRKKEAGRLPPRPDGGFQPRTKWDYWEWRDGDGVPANREIALTTPNVTWAIRE